MKSTAESIANALINIQAVGFKPENPITFKSGIVSPVYVDNRKFPYHPEAWELVIDGFREIISQEWISFDVIAGIETAGIPHSSALGYATSKPSVFVRKKVKDHGTKSRVEGGVVQGKKVLLIEDLVTTGGSSLAGVEALRTEQAIVDDLLCIVTYGFEEATRNFAAAKVQLHTLTTFEVILDEAVTQKVLSENQKEVVADWFADPHGWAKRHGHA